MGPCAKACDGGRGSLQPIDADRLLVAGHEAEPDIDEISRLQHLLGGLGKAALIAVERRQAEDAGQPQKCAKHEKRKEGTFGRGSEGASGRARFRSVSDG